VNVSQKERDISLCTQNDLAQVLTVFEVIKVKGAKKLKLFCYASISYTLFCK